MEWRLGVMGVTVIAFACAHTHQPRHIYIYIYPCRFSLFLAAGAAAASLITQNALFNSSENRIGNISADAIDPIKHSSRRQLDYDTDGLTGVS